VPLEDSDAVSEPVGAGVPVPEYVGVCVTDRVAVLVAVVVRVELREGVDSLDVLGVTDPVRVRVEVWVVVRDAVVVPVLVLLPVLVPVSVGVCVTDVVGVCVAVGVPVPEYVEVCVTVVGPVPVAVPV